MSAARLRIACTLVGASLAVAGCYREYSLVDPPGRDGGARDAALPLDAGRPDAGWREPVGLCAVPSPVDLLFVIDSSNSMAEEQASLVEQLPRLVSELADPPDSDGDGVRDWPAIADLQVGVVTTDMGSGGFDVPTCDRGALGRDFGDDGILRARAAELPGCEPSYPPIFRFSGGDPVAFAAEVACVASVGTSGCGFEQPLEAALKALSPSAPTAYTGPDYRPPTFFRSTLGHGDRENAGFVRDDSLLAVVIVTDEEDCSVRDPELLDPASPTYGSVDLNLRCFSFPEAVNPVERYVDGLLALRARRPEHIAVAVIAGIPVEAAVERPTAADFDAILSHPAMIEQVDPAMPTRLVPSCNVPGRGVAFPPRRLVRLAAGLGEGRSTVQSICQESFMSVIDPVVQLIARRACQAYEVL